MIILIPRTLSIGQCRRSMGISTDYMQCRDEPIPLRGTQGVIESRVKRGLGFICLWRIILLIRYIEWRVVSKCVKVTLNTAFSVPTRSKNRKHGEQSDIKKCHLPIESPSEHPVVDSGHWTNLHHQPWDIRRGVTVVVAMHQPQMRLPQISPGAANQPRTRSHADLSPRWRYSDWI